MVREKVSAKLAMLKLQVSPHFLFSTLNNIRWLTRRKSDQTEAAIVMLAQLLRYIVLSAKISLFIGKQEIPTGGNYADEFERRYGAK